MLGMSELFDFKCLHVGENTLCILFGLVFICEHVRLVAD
jgi:hypothetical protein